MEKDYFAEDFGGEQDFFAQDFGGAATQTAPPPTSALDTPDTILPGKENVKQKMAERSSAGREAGLAIAKWAGEQVRDPLGSIMRRATPVVGPANDMMALAKAQPALEATIANPALEMQSGNYDPKSLYDAAGRGFSGQQTGQMGDLVRTTGIGGKFNEPLAAGFGLAANAALGAAGGKIADKALGIASAPVQSTIKAAGAVNNIRQPVKFAKHVRGSMFQERKLRGQVLDTGITDLSNANPTKTTDLSDSFRMMKDALDSTDNPGLRTDVMAIVKKVKDTQLVKRLQDLIKDPDQASALTLREAEDIKRAVQQSPIIQRKLQQGQFANLTPADHEILDLMDNIKDAQSAVFPELSEIRRPYAEFMQAYNRVKGKFREGTLLGKIRGGFGDEETMQLIEKVLPPEVVEEITNYRNTRNAGRAVGATVGTGVGLYAASKLPVARKFFNALFGPNP